MIEENTISEIRSGRPEIRKKAVHLKDALHLQPDIASTLLSNVMISKGI
tara:strand:- start:8344 stop:8490 length:147 start_codon:yes stop_codon:yes gene_type:complete